MGSEVLKVIGLGSESKRALQIYFRITVEDFIARLLRSLGWLRVGFGYVDCSFILVSVLWRFVFAALEFAN
jgi:hypothetical protein